jgi:hypothetical protein
VTGAYYSVTAQAFRGIETQIANYLERS